VWIWSVDMEAIWSSSASSTAIAAAAGGGDDDMPRASEVGTGGEGRVESSRSSSRLKLGKEEAAELS
jgi:hypothetical protein